MVSNPRNTSVDAGVGRQALFTRRRALSASLATLAAAGAASALPAPTVAAMAPQTLAVIVNTDDLRQESLEALTAYREKSGAAEVAYRVLVATLTPAQRELFGDYVEAAHGVHDASHFMEYTEIARHIPGIAPILWTVYYHHPLGWFDRIGRCCMTDSDGAS